MYTYENMSLDTILEGTEGLEIMSPEQFLVKYPKCDSIYHTGGWFTRIGLDTLVQRHPELARKRFGFILRKSDIPVIGGRQSADIYLIEEPELCAGLGGCACGAHLDNHTVLDECVDIMIEALEQADTIEEE